MSVRGTLFPELISKQIVSKYKSPLGQFLRKGFADSDSYLVGVFATGYTLIYNTTKVKPNEVPRSYEDLLDARWKNRLVMDREEYDWLAGIIDLMGEKKAIAFFRRLVDEQQLAFNRGHTLMTQLLAAGEYDLMVDGYVPNAVQFKKARAPIDFVLTNPTLGKAAPVYRYCIEGTSPLCRGVAPRLPLVERSPGQSRPKARPLDDT